jgi:hypothetical protein
MMEKKVKGLMFSPTISGAGHVFGPSYEQQVQRMLGCQGLSNENFRKCFVEAMEREADLLSLKGRPQHLVLLFDEFNSINDSSFAFFLMQTFTHIQNVIPVFITMHDSVANTLCYTNKGVKMRPFPSHIDLGCDWQSGDPKYQKGAAISWMPPVWKNEDMKQVVASQKVSVDAPRLVLPAILASAGPMLRGCSGPMIQRCLGVSSIEVPMVVDPNADFTGTSMTPGQAMATCKNYTRQHWLAGGTGSRTQPLVQAAVAHGGIELGGAAA